MRSDRDWEEALGPAFEGALQEVLPEFVTQVETFLEEDEEARVE